MNNFCSKNHKEAVFFTKNQASPFKNSHSKKYSELTASWLSKAGQLYGSQLSASVVARLPCTSHHKRALGSFERAFFQRSSSKKSSIEVNTITVPRETETTNAQHKNSRQHGVFRFNTNCLNLICIEKIKIQLPQYSFVSQVNPFETLFNLLKKAFYNNC